ELGEDGDAKKNRRDYAEDYLRKIINLEVVVPSATPDQQRTLLTGATAPRRPELKSDAQRLVDFLRSKRPLAWVAGTVVLTSLCFWYGSSISVPEGPKPAHPATTEKQHDPKAYSADFNWEESAITQANGNTVSTVGKAAEGSKHAPKSYHV